jgi:hypoxanthine phosphoribosyltransferase
MKRSSSASGLYNDLEAILLTEDEIQARIRELAADVSRDYAGRDLFMMSVLKGSVIFLADITRTVTLPVEFGFMTISTYRGATAPQAEPEVTNRTFTDLEGRNVLLVEDILDSGATIAFARRWVTEQGAKSVRACVLLAKEGYRESLCPDPEYVGFEIPNVFVVGYGLDYNEKYRNLRCVGVLKPSAYNKMDLTAQGGESGHES